MSAKTDRIRTLRKQVASKMAERGKLPTTITDHRDRARVQKAIERTIAYLQHELQQLEADHA